MIHLNYVLMWTSLNVNKSFNESAPKGAKSGTQGGALRESSTPKKESSAPKEALLREKSEIQTKENAMPQSLSNVYTHIIFSTKHRQHLIDDAIEPELIDYLEGVCKHWSVIRYR